MIYKLKAKRAEVGIKQKEFAQTIGITPQYLQLIETHKVEPRRDLMIKIAAALNSTPSELFFYEQEAR